MSVDGAGSGRQSMRGARSLRQKAPSATAARMQLKVNLLGSILLASGAVALVQAPQPAVATGQAATDTDQGAGPGGLQEVVVTANKRRENIQDVPIAISAITASDLAAHGVQDTLDVAAAIPGLTMQGSMNGLQAHLRGVGTSAIQA